MRKLILLSIILLASANAMAQGIPINTWRSHLAYTDGLYTLEVKDRVFCATKNGLYAINKEDFGVEIFSKVDGFSDNFARIMAYSAEHDMLFIAYEDGNIDIVQNNTITNVPDLRSLNPIRDIYIFGDICYIAHREGVSEYRIKKKEFGDSYDPACKNVPANSITVLNDYLYVSSSAGVYKAPVSNGFLRDCNLWQSVNNTSCNQIVTFSGNIWGAFSDGVLRYYDGTKWIDFHTDTDDIKSLEVNHNKLVLTRSNNIIIVEDNLGTQIVPSNQQNHAVLDNAGNLWLAKNLFSCIRMNPATKALDFFMPNGPATAAAYKLYNFNNTIWVATGGINGTGGFLYINDGFFKYENDYWTNYNAFTVPNWFTLKDIVDIVTDPITGRQWVASLDSGLVDFDAKQNRIAAFYNTRNSSLQANDPASTSPSVSGLAFDADNNLWVANYRAQRQLSVRTNTGKWYSFNLGTRKSVTNVVIDKYNQVWVLVPREGGLYVYNYGKTIQNPDDGDEIRDLTTASGNGALPDNNVISMVCDKEGQVWVGTNNGVAVFAEPAFLFSKSTNFDAQQIWVENGKESGYLLAGQAVSCIAVDGGNRKWFGTRSGAYLTSPDGSQILKYFTTRNSPLISNNIQSIEVNGVTGEVFFGTDKGIVSYRSTATEGGDKHGDVYAYPNPVKPGYSGPIAITGLVRDAVVKITDITGKLVFETKAEGGQAVWNGKNFNGEDANSGVYMVFSTNKEGTETAVTKILIIR